MFRRKYCWLGPLLHVRNPPGMAALPGWPGSAMALTTPSTGYCRDVQLVGDCDVSEMGFWKLSQSQASSWSTALAACRELCAGCAGCSYVSASLRARECSWYESCDLQALQSEQPGFRSVAVTGRPRVEPLISTPPAEEEPKPQIAWPLRGGRELRCAARRLARGEPTKVSFFGTSVTAGHHLGTSHTLVALLSGFHVPYHRSPVVQV